MGINSIKVFSECPRLLSMRTKVWLWWLKVPPGKGYSDLSVGQTLDRLNSILHKGYSVPYQFFVPQFRANAYSFFIENQVEI
jgi:hypothetical protein